MPVSVRVPETPGAVCPFCSLSVMPKPCHHYGNTETLFGNRYLVFYDDLDQYESED